jgi:hypothetical protein
MTRKALFVLSFFGFLFQIGCGGSINFTPSESPTVTSVSVSCTPTSIRMVETSQCSATVSGTGSYSSGVTWSATDGTVTAGGVFTPSGTGTANITATSTEDTSKYGSVPLTVTDSQSPTITSVSVSCAPASIQIGQTSQCMATVQGTGAFSSAVTWATTGGTINSSGVFTPTAAGGATITATSTQDSTKSGSAPVAVNPTVTQNPCNITAAGTILEDGSLGGDPFLGDVYQIQGTITADYVDDDEAGNSTVTFTAPDEHTVTVGMFLLNQHTNGTNTYAVRVAAGYVSSGNWMPGTWTWSMNYSDRASNTCTATGSFTVQNAFAPSQGFLRQVGTTPNLETDGNGRLFFPTGMDWYTAGGTGSGSIFGEAAIPALAYVTVSGTAVTYVSGTNFTTQTLPSGLSVAMYLCIGGPGSCTLYPNLTINSSTSITLGSSGGTYANPIPAYLFFFRNLGQSFNHALSNVVTVAQAARFFAQWGTTFGRFPGGQGATVESRFLGTGYNDYNWSTTTGTIFGIPSVDLYFAAMHANGIHTMYGGSNAMSGAPCPSSVCNSTELSNLQNYYAMVSARWGAFYDVLELSNEQAEPQTWADYVGTVLTNGVSGIAGGNPADPYGHFFTNSFFPNNPSYYSSTYGPFSSGPSDAYLNFVDLPHQDNEYQATPVYNYMTDQTGNVNSCPGNGSGGYGGNTLPRFNGEINWPLGVPPATQTASAPNNEQNGPRFVDEQAVLNQCGGTVFNAITDQISINSTTPITSPTWYDTMSGRTILQRFMVGLDTSAAPITVTLGGGCASSACSYAALGSSNHIRLVLNSATGNSSTGIPNTVRTGTVTLTVPQSGMTGNWVNPSTGAVISTISPSSGSQTLNVPSFQYDIYLQLD